ncbi:nuclear transport factor 2 family protein [Undibacterium sp. TJN19]|uniref:nuclear transport factor 2 family protein n=1 Tax=Undibacterium sp. TJN19 TaxID=3413055 RepID=UPI003BF3A399
MSSLDTVQAFLKHVFSGNLDEALTLVTPDAQFISARPVANPRVPVHGIFTGPGGAREFFRLFGELLEPGEFNVTASFSEGGHVAMYGNLRHRSRQTGRDFPSNWALICCVQQGQLSLYHFYEDTAALEAAIA